jgi:hypothetical protein
MSSVFPLFYAGPVEYYSFLLSTERVIFEANEHYQKQTYRNRCCICDANGRLNLIIPVRHKQDKVPVKDILIANTDNWQKKHWKSLESSYRKSPYFEFYEHIFYPYYHQMHENLFSFNLSLTKQILQTLKVKSNFGFTDEYVKSCNSPIDYRTHFNSDSTHKLLLEYTQVFSNKLGFIHNLSIFDLIFNLGPDAKVYLMNKENRMNKTFS